MARLIPKSYAISRVGVIADFDVLYGISAAIQNSGSVLKAGKVALSAGSLGKSCPFGCRLIIPWTGLIGVVVSGQLNPFQIPAKPDFRHASDYSKGA